MKQFLPSKNAILEFSLGMLLSKQLVGVAVFAKVQGPELLEFYFQGSGMYCQKQMSSSSCLSKSRGKLVMVIDMPNFNLMTFFVVCNKCTFFAKTSFVVGRRKTASDFMDLRKKKKRKLDRVCSKKSNVANKIGKNVKFCRFK